MKLHGDIYSHFENICLFRNDQISDENCRLFKTETDVKENDNSFRLGSRIGRTINPIQLSLHHWDTRVSNLCASLQLTASEISEEIITFPRLQIIFVKLLGWNLLVSRKNPLLVLICFDCLIDLHLDDLSN